MADQTHMALELLKHGVSGDTIKNLIPLQKLNWDKVSKVSDNCENPRAWLLFLLQNSITTETLIDVLLKNKRVFSEELSLPKDNKVIDPIILALMNTPTDQGWKAFENVTFFVAEQYRSGKPSQTFWAALKQMEDQAPKKFAAMMSRITEINVYFSEECAKKNQSKDTKEAVNQKKAVEKIAEQLVKKVIQNEAGYVSLDGVDLTLARVRLGRQLFGFSGYDISPICEALERLQKTTKGRQRDINLSSLFLLDIFCFRENQLSETNKKPLTKDEKRLIACLDCFTQKELGALMTGLVIQKIFNRGSSEHVLDALLSKGVSPQGIKSLELKDFDPYGGDYVDTGVHDSDMKDPLDFLASVNVLHHFSSGPKNFIAKTNWGWFLKNPQSVHSSVAGMVNSLARASGQNSVFDFGVAPRVLADKFDEEDLGYLSKSDQNRLLNFHLFVDTAKVERQKGVLKQAALKNAGAKLGTPIKTKRKL